jgi:putative hydrolase of the HAD superfamily
MSDLSSPTPALAVVWCDFGGVLTPHLDEAIGHIVQASGVSWPVLMTAAGKVAAEMGLTGLGPLELGLLTQAEWGSRLAQALPPEHQTQVDLGRWDEYWYRDRPVNLDLLKVLEELSAAGVRIGMLTNSVAEWEPHRARMLAETTVFEGYVRSHEIGLAKPDPRIYAYADQVLPADGGTVVFIDDLLVNCVAAEANGWVGIHHLSTADTVARLLELASASRSLTKR